MAELVADGLPGRTVPPRDPDALAAAMAAEVERGPAPPGEVQGAPSALFPTWEMLFDASFAVLLEARERRSGLIG